MNKYSKKLWVFIACFVCLLLCGAGVLWAQHREKNEMVPVSVSGYDQTGSKVVVLSYYVNRQIAGQPGGRFCCVMLPKYWRAGLSFELDWDYTEQSEGSPSPQKAQIEIEKYTPDRIGTLTIHFLPNHQVKAIVNDRGFGSPFYPLLKEYWVNWGINEDLLRNWKEDYYEMIKGEIPPDDEDWKWAAQWGLYKEEATRKNNVTKQEQTK